jgi:hypothetical protein
LATSTTTTKIPVTDDGMALMEGLQKADAGTFLRSLAETVRQILVAAEVEGLIGAARGERATWRNGYRDRALDTRLGQLNPRRPKLLAPAAATSIHAGRGHGRTRHASQRTPDLDHQRQDRMTVAATAKSGRYT